MYASSPAARTAPSSRICLPPHTCLPPAVPETVPQAFEQFNGPLRDWKYDTNKIKPLIPTELANPHPLPITLCFLCEGLRLMRKVSEEAQKTKEGLGGNSGGCADLSRCSRHSSRPGPASVSNRDSHRMLPGMGAGAAATPFDIEGGGEAAGRTCSGADLLRPKFGSVRLSLLPGATEAGSPMQRMQSLTHPSQQQLVEGSQNAAPRGRVLWRGMRGMNLSRYFLKHGGCEMSPMSTTDDLAIAVRYARDAQDGCEPTALLFR